MHTIEAVLARDFARRGLAWIALTVIGITALPLWLFTALNRDGVLDPTSREAIVLHWAFTLFMGFLAAVAVIQAIGPLARFFVRPISAARLVACQMAIGMVTVGLMYVIAATLLNLGGAGWPLVGPALFLATALACGLAAIWSLEGSIVGQVIGCTATNVPLVFWFSRCYGATLKGEWRAMWQHPTAGQMLTLAGISLAAYAIAIVGVSRVRRGDQFDFAPVKAWWERQRTRGSAAIEFRSPAAAQAWSEWREKLGPAPAAIVAGVMLVAIIAWFAGRLPIGELLGLSLGIPFVLIAFLIPLVYGLVVGSCNKDGKNSMNHVLATRPVTDAFLAQMLLRQCALATMSAWLTWLVGLLVVTGIAMLTGNREAIGISIADLRSQPSGILMALLTMAFVPLASWTTMSLIAALFATGRRWFFFAVFFAAFGLVLIFALLRGVFPPNVFDSLAAGCLLFSSGAYLVGTAWAFVAAIRRRMMSLNHALVAGVGWMILAILTAIAWPAPLASSGVWFAHSLGLLALSILPFAAMPLAIRWNRHR